MSRYCINATWDDVPHLTEDAKATMLESYPVYMRDARTKGLPMLGSGVIFPVPDELIMEEPFRIPIYWPRLGAMDFGIDHPFAAVEIAYDDAGDVAHIVKAFTIKDATPIVHVSALKSWGKWLPWVWPHDGLERDKGSGEQIAKQYGDHGLNMMGSRITFPDGSNGVEAGLMLMLERMESGRLKVFSNLNDWFKEKRSYHRLDGQVVKKKDDLMAATRYGIMGLRHSLLPPELRAELRAKHAGRNMLGSDPLANY